MIEPVELKPCPFCGSEHSLILVPNPNGKTFIVRCICCQAEGPPPHPSLCEHTEASAIAAWNRRALPDPAADFQSRVAPWMDACFGPEISGDRLERGDRLLEEVLELLQSGDYPRERIAALVDYTYSRPKGEPAQEAGGVMVTLAAYCLAHDLDMHEAGERELARIWTKVDAIRAKQAAKPVGSALPIATEPAADLVVVVADAIEATLTREDGWMVGTPALSLMCRDFAATALAALAPHMAAREQAARNAAIDAAADDEATLTLVGLAIERAGCPGREGPFGGYDYGYNTEFYGPAPAAGRYVIRDFRDPASPDWGKPIHYTPDEDAHDAMFAKLTQYHTARAAILALKEPRP